MAVLDVIEDSGALVRAKGQPFFGLRAAARRFDYGDKLGYLETNVALGLQHPKLGPALRRVLQSYL